MFQPEDEKELEEKFSDNHRKAILKPKKKKKKEKIIIRNTFYYKLSHYNCVLLIKILSIPATS